MSDEIKVDGDLTKDFNEAARGAPPKDPGGLTLEYRPPVGPAPVPGGGYQGVVWEPVAAGGPPDLRFRLHERFNEVASRVGEAKEREKGSLLSARFNREASLRARFNQAAQPELDRGAGL
ncbi:hypothetical protein [Engelhardtia mirabilis]|uniref:Uncharacterized protein n=1 Tax=Engelhardtia mirabilis TaxID=2528011 RepID=A0A518BT62_9BACT|nr:hypothetical protein Pla133_52880 [Planctomycetes bacterium Pla133]QDV04492.1 hypothetical protein Pla86_52880 [Planctomycetes bacterium Pla86]